MKEAIESRGRTMDEVEREQMYADRAWWRDREAPLLTGLRAYLVYGEKGESALPFFFFFSITSEGYKVQCCSSQN